jgi:hypothetical protein
MINNSMLMSIVGYALVGYLVSTFVSVSYALILNRSEHEK